MKMAGVLSVAVLLLLAPSAVSQIPDDKLIVPGRRIGKWTLDMTVEAIVRKLGEPPLLLEGFRDFGIPSQPGLLAYDWRGSAGLGLATRDDRTILFLYTSSSLAFKTAKGVKYGGPLGSVEAAYGEPTATFLAPHGSVVMYEGLGLAVRYWYRLVGVIAVFRPENARRIWKF